MSVPVNSLTFREWFEYAEHLARNLTPIGHNPEAGIVRYARVRFQEVISLSINELQGPCLLAEMPVSEGIDNKSNNLLAQRYLAWTIADRVDNQTTDVQRMAKETNCESLALRVLGRLRADRIHLQKAGTSGVFADVAIDRWEGECITEFLSGNWVGYRIMVPVLVNDKRLTYDPQFWSDGIGQGLFTDLTGLSCAALNHPTLGLTLAQRLQCILPQYDFSSEATQDAVTPQQQQDLIEWLGAGGGGGGSTTAIFQLNGTQVGSITGNGTLNIPVRRAGVSTGSLVDGVWEIPPCPTVPPLTLSLNAVDEDVIQVITNPTTGLETVAVLNSEDEPIGVGTGAGVFVDDVIIYQTDGNPVIEVARVKAQGTFNLPQVQIYYQDDTVILAWSPIDSGWNGDYIQPVDVVPARNILDQDGNVVSSRKVTLADLFEDSIPPVNIPTLCGRIAEEASTPDLIATCVISAGKRPGVLAELLPTVDEADVLAQIIGPLTPSQDAVVAVTVQLRDSAANNIGTADTYAPGTNTTKTAPDGSVQRRDSAGTAIGSSIPVRSGQTDLGVTCPDGAVTIRNSVSTTLHTVSVRSNGVATQPIADSIITRPDGTTVGLPATVALDVRTYRSGIAYNFGLILSSGQTTSYRTGDEGDIRSGGFFDYTPPIYPVSYARLGADFVTLQSNNIHGNTLRFTDRTGAAAATSGNRIVQDHLTGVEWYVPSSLPGNITWNNAIDASVAFSFGGNSDWRIPNDKLFDTITNDELAQTLNYGPFASIVGAVTFLWTCTTIRGDTTTAKRMTQSATASGVFVNAAKTSTSSYILCRRFI